MVWYVISNAVLQSLPEQKFWWQWQWDRQDSQSLEVLRSLWQLDGPPNKRRPKEVWCTTMNEKYGVGPKYLQTKHYHKDENYSYIHGGFTVKICQHCLKLCLLGDRLASKVTISMSVLKFGRALSHQKSLLQIIWGVWFCPKIFTKRWKIPGKLTWNLSQKSQMTLV